MPEVEQLLELLATSAGNPSERAQAIRARSRHLRRRRRQLTVAAAALGIVVAGGIAAQVSHSPARNPAAVVPTVSPAVAPAVSPAATPASTSATPSATMPSMARPVRGNLAGNKTFLTAVRHLHGGKTAQILYAGQLEGRTYVIVVNQPPDGPGTVTLLEGSTAKAAALTTASDSGVGTRNPPTVMTVALLSTVKGPVLLVVAEPGITVIRYVTSRSSRAPPFTSADVVNGVVEVTLPAGSNDTNTFVEGHTHDGALEAAGYATVSDVPK